MLDNITLFKLLLIIIYQNKNYLFISKIQLIYEMFIYYKFNYHYIIYLVK